MRRTAVRLYGIYIADNLTKPEDNSKNLSPLEPSKKPLSLCPSAPLNLPISHSQTLPSQSPSPLY